MTRRSLRNEEILAEGGVYSLDPALASPKVVVAEDDPAMRHLLSSQFRAARCEVVEARDGRELWKVLLESFCDRETPREPDLIITDVRMPGESGLEVLQRARETAWLTPWIVLTAFGDIQTHFKAYRLGATYFFDKPFDVDVLVEIALEVVRGEHRGRSR